MDRSNSIIENIKWFMFADDVAMMKNELGFENDLEFVAWVGDGHSFIVSDGMNEYRITISKEEL